MIFARQNTIYGIGPQGCPCHLGDLWAGTSYLLKKSAALRSPIVVSNVSGGGLPTGPMIGEILGLLEHIGVFHFTNVAPQKIVDLYHSFGHDYVRTRVKWKAATSRIVCYQFDGRTEFDRKNPTTEETHRFLDHVRMRGYEPINIGGYRPLSHCIEIASTAEFFVGAPSGLGHVCASVGTPIHIIYNQKPLVDLAEYAYRNKPITYYRTMDDFLNTGGIFR